MGKSGTERQCEYLERKKRSGEYEELQRKNREQQRDRRSAFLSRVVRQQNKKHQRARRERLRAAPRDQPSTSGIPVKAGSGTAASAFASRQHRGKCIKRVSNALPASPRKRKELIVEIARINGLVVKNAPAPIQPVRRAARVSTVVRKAVDEFYNSDTISFQCPGKRDCRKVQVDGVAILVSIRYLVMSLKEAHAIFHEENAQLPIGFAMFARLRPPHVLLRKDTPHYVCTCIVHENIRFLLLALHQKGLPIHTEFRQFISQVVCDQASSECMQSGCEHCPGLAFIEMPDYVANDTCEWNRWEASENKWVNLHAKKETVLECFQMLTESLPFFLSHTYVKRQQSESFKRAKENIAAKQVVAQVDFANKYECQHQNEIQSAHWGHKKVSIFTAVLWYKTDPKGPLEIKSYAMACDNTDQDKYHVHCALKFLLREAMVVKPDMEELIIYSDGSSSQFKNKYTLCNITYLSKIFGISIKWNFFESYHGKGAVDAVWGKAKNMAWVASKSGSIVMNAANFVQVCSKTSKKIKFAEIPVYEISATKIMLDQQWHDIKTIRNTLSIHHVEVVAVNVIKVSPLTLDNSARRTHCFK